MYLRISRVAWFMFKCLVAFNWRRFVHAKNQDALLDQDYKDWSKYVLGNFDVDLTVTGREHIPVPNRTGEEKRKLVIMSNHQSQLDIPALVMALDRRLGFVAKRELARIPILGYFMVQVGCIFIDRSDGRGANIVLEKAALEMGATPLVIFPEGTRSKDSGFLPLKQGGCRLASLADAIILPVLIQGTRNAAEARQDRTRVRKPARLRIFPVLDTRGLGEGKTAFIKIKDHLEKCWHSPNDPI